MSASAKLPGRVPGEALYLRDVGLVPYGARAGLHPETIRDVRAESATDAEAARRLGCSPSLVSQARRDGTPGRNRANPWDRTGGGMKDAMTFGRIILLLQHGGFYGLSAIAIAIGEPEAGARRWLDFCLAAGFVVRIEGKGYRIAEEGEQVECLTDMRKEGIAFARTCPKNPEHGATAGRYCATCKARLGPTA